MKSAGKLDKSFVKRFFYFHLWTRRVLYHLYDAVWRLVPFIGNSWVTIDPDFLADYD